MNQLTAENPLTLWSGELLPKIHLEDRAEAVLRGALFAYLLLALCPIYYLPFSRGVDNTFAFALNYAHVQHLAIGRDIVWTWGPLSYLALPMDLGHNVVKGLCFELVVLGILVFALWDVFYRSRYPLRNILIFSIFLGLSATVGGSDQVLFRCALVLLLQYYVRAGTGRYLLALTILGFLPLIQFTWFMVTAGAVAGLIIFVLLARPSQALRDGVLAAIIPLSISGLLFRLLIGSFSALPVYLKGSAELSSGFNLAMSLWSAPTELLAAFETVILLAIAMFAVSRTYRTAPLFLGTVLAVPLFVSFKHGFVRQDAHIHHFFCFAAIVLGLTALIAPLEKQRTAALFTVVTLVFILIWQDNVARTSPRFALRSTGLSAPIDLLNTLRYLLGTSPPNHEVLVDSPVEPEITGIVGKEPLAALSEIYAPLYLDGLNLKLYPVIQRYSAYTPYLDQLNANWIRDHGPRFLIFDGQTIDGRHPWTETPAMWVEVYRWYKARWLGPRNLLLERRATPRFTRFESPIQSRVGFGEAIQFPASREPIFWTMHCQMNTAGRVRALLFRVPEVTMKVEQKDQPFRTFRALPAVQTAPSLGNYLPETLPQFKEVFEDGVIPDFATDKLTFGGPGSAAYAPQCTLQLLHPVP